MLLHSQPEHTVIVRVCWGWAVVFDWGGTWCTQFYPSLAPNFPFQIKVAWVCLSAFGSVLDPALSQWGSKQITWSRSQVWHGCRLETRCRVAFSRSLFKARCLLVSGHRPVVTDCTEQRKQSTTTSGSLTISLYPTHQTLDFFFFWKFKLWTFFFFFPFRWHRLVGFAWPTLTLKIFFWYGRKVINSAKTRLQINVRL